MTTILKANKNNEQTQQKEQTQKEKDLFFVEVKYLCFGFDCQNKNKHFNKCMLCIIDGLLQNAKMLQTTNCH